jgi:hypothetical protein
MMAAWERKKTIAAGIGAAAAAVAGLLLGRRWLARDEHDPAHAPAIKHRRPPGPVGYTGSARPAGPEAMRDPPNEWTDEDEALDESFPASDPPGIKHVD